MKSIGTATGLVSLAGLFDSCLSLYSKIDALKDYPNEFRDQYLLYEFERNRLEALRQIEDDVNDLLQRGNDLSARHNPRSSQSMRQRIKRKLTAPLGNSGSSDSNTAVDAKAKQSLSRALKWVVADKPRFDRILATLKECNSKLELIAPNRAVDVVSIKVIISTISSITEVEELQALQDEYFSKYETMWKTAKAKKLVEAYTKHSETAPTNRDAKLPWDTVFDQKGDRINISRAAIPMGRTQGQYKRPGDVPTTPAVIEWRNNFQTTKTGVASKSRLNLLCDMVGGLRETSEGTANSEDATEKLVANNKGPALEFKFLECVGWISESDDMRKVGLVFLYPTFARDSDANLQHAPIVSLWDQIHEHKSKNAPIPSLGRRFNLAVGLAKALTTIFGVGCAHRGLRSRNILFFDGVRPFLAGFTYSLRGDYQAISNSQGDEDADYQRYRPPNYNSMIANYALPAAASRPPSLPFIIGLDIYAMGITLLEIGLWRSAEDLERQAYEKHNYDSTQGQHWTDGLMEDVNAELSARMGDNYCTVVRSCLKEGSRDWTDKTFKLAVDYSVNILAILSKCQA